MQTILGSGGAIGSELAKSLVSFTDKIKLVSRNPKKVNNNDILHVADLTKQNELFEAVKDSEIVYLTVGLKYDINVWTQNWPLIMKNTIEACKANNSKLVFFDNIYMYDKNFLRDITEETPQNPPSRKGKIRKQIVDELMLQVKKGNLQALIVRSADFYGPSIKNSSMLTEMVFNNLSKGKRAMWLYSTNLKHSFTYTPDAARATAILGNSPNAYNQVWHLPTAKNPLTGKEFIDQIANELNVNPKVFVLSKFMLKAFGVFVPVLKEMVEMIYQYDRDYIFNSDKFENKFNFTPTSYKDGIKNIVEIDYSKSL
jgi:nucleoside-diphosphate-sugar epimerase